MPLVLERLNSNSLHIHRTYIWYFFVLSQCKDIRTLPYLFGYELKEVKGVLADLIRNGKMDVGHFRDVPAYAGSAFIEVAQEYIHIIVAFIMVFVAALFLFISWMHRKLKRPYLKAKNLNDKALFLYL